MNLIAKTSLSAFAFRGSELVSVSVLQFLVDKGEAAGAQVLVDSRAAAGAPREARDRKVISNPRRSV